MSLLGIVQHFTSDAKIYGFRTLSPGGDSFGPFVNRNHFAGFVELTLPAGLALLIFRGLRRDMIPLTGLLTIVPVGAMILSGSRGGIVSFGFRDRRAGGAGALPQGSRKGPRLVALRSWDSLRWLWWHGWERGERSSDFPRCIQAISLSRAARTWLVQPLTCFSLIRLEVPDWDRWSQRTRSMKLLRRPRRGPCTQRLHGIAR